MGLRRRVDAAISKEAFQWEASAGRVVTLWRTFGELSAAADRDERIAIDESPDDCLRLKGLSVAQHNGRVVINGAEAVFHPGEKVLLRGESGTGKSTLIRAIAGLSPWGTGEVPEQHIKGWLALSRPTGRAARLARVSQAAACRTRR